MNTTPSAHGAPATPEPAQSKSHADKEREFFAHWALNEEGDAIRWQREFRGVLSALGPRPLGNVLSLGCGRGYFERMLARQATRVTGLDLSPESVEEAKMRAEAAGVRNVHFECADVTSFDLNEKFDTVLCVAFLHHLTDAQVVELLARIHRHLTPNGLLHTQDPNVHGVLRHIGRVLMGGRYDSYHTPDERELDPESVRRLFLEAGFSRATIQYMDLTLIPGTQFLPTAPRWVMVALDAVDKLWCSSPLARHASGFAVNGFR